MNITAVKLKTAALILLAAWSMAGFAQDERTMYVMKNGEVIFESPVSDIDSIVFNKPDADCVEINGVFWATRNVDKPGTFAVRPEDPGMFYQWNRRTGWPATGTVTGWDNSYSTGDVWAKVNDPSPSGYHVPTIWEIQSLFNTTNVSNTWVTQNGVNGRIFTDRTNGNSIFLPAAGYRRNNDGMLGGVGSSGFYWCRSVYDPNYAYDMDFNSGHVYWLSYYYLGGGVSVRPVAEENASVSPSVTTLSASNITASSATLGGNISNIGSPAYTERGVCYSISQNPTINNSKLVDSGSGTLGSFSVNASGLSANTTYYVRAYVTNTEGTFYGEQISFFTTIGTTTGEWVEINGVKWATCNVDNPGTFAARPEDPGMFYQWNRKIGWNATDPMINSNGDTTWDNSTPAGTAWEKANDPSPAGWRVPTLTEFEKLFDAGKVTWVWTTENGKKGYRFTDRESGKSILLPAIGYRSYLDATIHYVGSYGYYWSSTAIDSYGAYFLNFGSGSASCSGNGRGYGFSVRPVAD